MYEFENVIHAMASRNPSEILRASRDIQGNDMESRIMRLELESKAALLMIVQCMEGLQEFQKFVREVFTDLKNFSNKEGKSDV